MAQITHVDLVDDLDGTTAHQQDIVFGVDGITWLIDLSDDNAQRLRADIGKWAAVARRAPGKNHPRDGSRAGRHANGSHNRAIRDWWRSKGHELSDRGRIPGEVVDAFYRENIAG